MKAEKQVTMHCPSCKADFDQEPIIMLNPRDGSSHLELFLPRKCRFCGTGLVRMVTKVKIPKEVQNAKPIQKLN